VVVRQCTATDAAQLVAREPASRGYANGALARQRAGLTDFLVALVDGVVVGSGELTTGQPAQLKSLAVEAPARGHGVGSAIIGAAEAIVAERVTFAGTGHRQLVLGVGLDNQRARQARIARPRRAHGAAVGAHRLSTRWAVFTESACTSHHFGHLTPVNQCEVPVLMRNTLTDPRARAVGPPTTVTARDARAEVTARP